MPSREEFTQKLAIDSEEKYEEMIAFVNAFTKLTDEVQKFLKEHNLDDPTPV